MVNLVETMPFPLPSSAQKQAEDDCVLRHENIPLPFAPVGQRLRVISCSNAGKHVIHRLASMGITEGSLIEIVQQSAGNMLLAVGNTRLAIAPSIAHKVIVVPVTS